MYSGIERMDSWRYTVEPGVDECRLKLNPGINGGGIGSLQAATTKYFDFYHNEDEPGSLRHFLNMLTPVEDDVTYYCATSYNAIKTYVTNYLSLFISASDARMIVNQIEQHSHARRHDEKPFLRRTIAVGTRFYNDIFYESSWAIAEKMFPTALLSSCLDSLSCNNPEPMQIPLWKLFVNAFDKDCFEFELSMSDNCVQMPHMHYSVMGIPWRFECSKHDFEKSFKPYILLFSNWTLLLLCLLAGEKFGQCAFGIYWETGQLAHSDNWFW